MKTAKLMSERSFVFGEGNWKNTQKVWKLSVPHCGYRFIITSAALVTTPDTREAITNETFVFASDHKGNMRPGGELIGSQRGTLDHVVVLMDMGYAPIGKEYGSAFKELKA